MDYIFRNFKITVIKTDCAMNFLKFIVSELSKLGCLCLRKPMLLKAMLGFLKPP